MGVQANEVDLLQFTNTLPNGGTYTLYFRNVTSSALSFDATADQVQSALEQLVTIGTGNVSVTGNYSQGGFVITWQGGLGGQNIDTTGPTGILQFGMNVGGLLPSALLFNINWLVTESTAALRGSGATSTMSTVGRTVSVFEASPVLPRPCDDHRPCHGFLSHESSGSWPLGSVLHEGACPT